MTAYGPPPTSRSTASPVQNAALMLYVAGGLGVLSFIWGFLKFVTEGSGSDQAKYGGYALGSPSVAIIGLSLVAGLLAAAAAWENKPATLAPVIIAVAALLLTLGVLIGKGSISDGSGGGNPKIGIGIGLILELITVILQVGVLVFAWLGASGKMPAKRTPAPAWPGQPQQQPYPGQYGPPPQTAQPGGYGPPQTYGPGQPPAPAPHQGYGPPPTGPSYGPPPGQ